MRVPEILAASGPMDFLNFLAALAAVVLPLALAWGLFAWGEPKRRRRIRRD